MAQKFLLTLIQQELCLYLDEERNAVGAGLRRDDGDGSSSSTNPDEAASIPHPSGNIKFIYYNLLRTAFKGRKYSLRESLQSTIKPLQV